MRIRTQNINMQIGRKTLLHSLSVDLESNKLHLILGPNGAGKSTLIKLLSHQLKPTSGNVFYDGKNIFDFKVAELARFRAVLSQNIDFAFPLTVKEVVMMGRYPHFKAQPKKTDRDIVEESMDQLGIGNFENRDYTSLSGGEKQRVQFARIMAQIWPEDDAPKLLFLDEPLTFLDVKFQYEFLNKIQGLLQKQNLTVIGVLHDLNLAARFADNLLLLHEGRLMASGTKEEVLTPENIQQVYGMVPHLIRQQNRLIIDF